jgi:hypothetical protein
MQGLTETIEPTAFIVNVALAPLPSPPVNTK